MNLKRKILIIGPDYKEQSSTAFAKRKRHVVKVKEKIHR